MITVRVAAGTLKGRAIILGNEYRSAEITPQKVKEAFFSIIGESLENRNFLDLYGCSGQIGIEAVSRGAAFTAINELDKPRFSAIRNLVKSFGYPERVLLINARAAAAIGRLAAEGRVFDYIYADPPYDKRREATDAYDAVLERVASAGILAPDGLFVIQHFTGNMPAPRSGFLVLADTRVYGGNSLSFYRLESV